MTGIALSTSEFTNRLFLADLNQATFTPGSPGTWTSGAGQGFQNFPEFSLGGGPAGIAVAPGSHLGIVSGEFGGDQVGVIQLPSTAGGMPPWLLTMRPQLCQMIRMETPFRLGVILTR